MKVILFSGKAESGKTESCQILKELLKDKKVIKMSYSDYVKDTAKHLFCWNGKKDQKGRDLLQWWGTDYVKEKSPDFWAQAVVNLANLICDKYDYLLIDDLRFPNERYIWYYNDFSSIAIRIERPNYKNHLTESQKLHPSETSLDGWGGFDLKLYSSNRQELRNEIKDKLLPLVLQMPDKPHTILVPQRNIM